MIKCQNSNITNNCLNSDDKRRRWPFHRRRRVGNDMLVAISMLGGRNGRATSSPDDAQHGLWPGRQLGVVASSSPGLCNGQIFLEQWATSWRLGIVASSSPFYFLLFIILATGLVRNQFVAIFFHTFLKFKFENGDGFVVVGTYPLLFFSFTLLYFGNEIQVVLTKVSDFILLKFST